MWSQRAERKKRDETALGDLSGTLMWNALELEEINC